MKTAQEIFTRVATHLLTQNATASADGGCAYRTHDGLQCAVGCLIPETDYDPILEGTTIRRLQEFIGVPTRRVSYTLLESILAAQGITPAHYDLLAELQRIHDGVRHERWRAALAALASDFKLTMS